MIQLPENFDSIFRYIEVVSQRAEQLINGAKVRTESSSAKPTLQARDDVDAGEVEWRILTQEELDEQRQAMVEQFRSEMSTEEEGEEGEAIPDVLAPKVEAAEPAAEAEVEHDDELVRLQRLLGMMGSGPKPAEGTEEAAAEEDSAEKAPLDLADGGGDKVDEKD